MVINFYGKQFFKIQLGDLIIAYNPISKDSKGKAKFGSDIALVSFPHPDFNGVDEVSYGERAPFVISGPGEYEVREVFIRAFMVESQYEGVSGVNTIYQITLEGINILFLGALTNPNLPTQVLEAIDDVGILFIPVGNGLLPPNEAYKLGVKLESRIIIPMNFSDLKDADLKKFLKEGGAESEKPQEKLTLKPKDLADKEGDIVLLTPQTS